MGRATNKSKAHASIYAGAIESPKPRYKTFAKNKDVPGKPIVTKVAPKDTYQRAGATYHREPMAVKSLLWYLRLRASTIKNSTAVVKQWARAIKYPREAKASPPITKHEVSQFISITVVRATILFKSTWAKSLTKASIPPIRHRAMITGAP
jgi:hypothetical protein